MSSHVVKPAIGRHSITFLDPQDVQVVLHAKLGWSTKGIAEVTGLTEGQVQYRISKAQALEFGRGDDGKAQGSYRTGWRTGVSSEARMISGVIRAKLRRQIQRTLPPLIESIPAARRPIDV